MNFSKYTKAIPREIKDSERCNTLPLLPLKVTINTLAHILYGFKDFVAPLHHGGYG